MAWVSSLRSSSSNRASGRTWRRTATAECGGSRLRAGNWRVTQPYDIDNTDPRGRRFANPHLTANPGAAGRCPDYAAADRHRYLLSETFVSFTASGPGPDTASPPTRPRKSCGRGWSGLKRGLG